MARLTINDIAKLANVSPSTVSFVLNNRPGIKEETRQHVQAVIDQTGYTPNVHTRRLTLKKSFTIHVVMRQFSYPLNNLFSLEVLMGIFHEARRLGYDVLFTSIDYTSQDKDKNFAYVMDTISSNSVDGLILIQCSESTIINTLKETNTPFVCVDSHVPKDGSIVLVEADMIDATYQATNYLISCGHHHIGFIGADKNPEYHRMTFLGYQKAMLNAGLACRPEWIQKDSEEECATPSCMQSILACKNRPTAVLCAGDIFAVEAIRQAQKAGFQVPEDMSIMGVDDIIVSEFSNPPLTTMHLDKDEMGKKSIQVMHAILSKQPYEPINYIKTTLLIRNSICSPAK